MACELARDMYEYIILRDSGICEVEVYGETVIIIQEGMGLLKVKGSAQYQAEFCCFLGLNVSCIKIPNFLCS